MPEAIRVQDLSKTFNGSVHAVQNISFGVNAGEAFGFLGPNGAGKTTTVSMLTGGLAPSSGAAIVDGIDVFHDPQAIKRRIGLVFQESTADSDLTGRENLELAAALFGVPRRTSKQTIDSLLDRMQIGDAADPAREDLLWGDETAPRARGRHHSLAPSPLPRTSLRSASTPRGGRGSGGTFRSFARSTG